MFLEEWYWKVSKTGKNYVRILSWVMKNCTCQLLLKVNHRLRLLKVSSHLHQDIHVVTYKFLKMKTWFISIVFTLYDCKLAMFVLKKDVMPSVLQFGIWCATWGSHLKTSFRTGRSVQPTIANLQTNMCVLNIKPAFNTISDTKSLNVYNQKPDQKYFLA